MLSRVLIALQPYIGFTKHSDKAFDDEVTRWARSGVIKRRDGVSIKTRGDLEQLGFQVDILHESVFSYNCRVGETDAHITFHDYPFRLWQKKGAGSYCLSDKAIQVRNQSQPPPFI
jgi:hypothetical protein